MLKKQLMNWRKKLSASSAALGLIAFIFNVKSAVKIDRTLFTHRGKHSLMGCFPVYFLSIRRNTMTTLTVKVDTKGNPVLCK